MSKSNTHKAFKPLKRNNKRNRGGSQTQGQHCQQIENAHTTSSDSTKTIDMFDATYSVGLGGPVRRIRTPHKNDVLSGRGGSINSHRGNIQFREWVAKRKSDYNLAPSKQDKARVAREVIAMVQNQTPPGRFLQKDPKASHGAMSWWIEIDDDRIMSKTSQALREGAPEIRKKHHVEKPAPRIAVVAASVPLIKRPGQTPVLRYTVQSQPTAVPVALSNPRTAHEESLSVALSNPRTAHEESLFTQSQHSKSDVIPQPAQPQTEFASNKPVRQTGFDQSEDGDYEQPVKRVRLDYNGITVNPSDSTPPLTSVPAPTTEIEPLPENIAGLPEEIRNHSLALPDLSVGDIANEDFVNPFENELDFVSDFFSPRPGVIRDSSLGGETGVNGSKWTPSSDSKIPPAPVITGVRSNKILRGSSTNSMSKSSRSLSSILSDLPVSDEVDKQISEFFDEMNMIQYALHPDVEGEDIPTHLYPYRGSAFRDLRRQSSISSRGLDEKRRQ